MALTNQAPTPASVLSSTSNTGIKRIYVAAGVTVAPGDVIAKDSTKLAILADANGDAYAKVPAGAALNGGGPGQPVDYVEEDPNFIPGFAVVAGIPYFLSTTPGKMGVMVVAADLAAGMVGVFLGIGKTTTTLNFKIVSGGLIV